MSTEAAERPEMTREQRDDPVYWLGLAGEALGGLALKLHRRQVDSPEEQWKAYGVLHGGLNKLGLAMNAVRRQREAAAVDELTLARVRALVAEHPEDAVPVIELAELRRALGINGTVELVDTALTSKNTLDELVVFVQGRRRDCLRALRASTGESSQSDYWRWQGHAELSRQLLERLGAEVPQ